MSDSDCRYDFGPFRLDAPERRLLRDGLPVPLTPKAFDLLHLLVRSGGHLVTKDELIRGLWPDSAVEENNLTVNMSALRRALGDSKGAGGRYIETVPKVGYRFVAEVTERREGSRRPAPPSADQGEDVEVIKSLAVLPLVNESRRPRLDYLCDGITESVISSLSRLHGLRVMARSAVYRYKGVDVLDAGRELRVAAVVTGRVLSVGRQLVIGAELVRVSDGAQLWSEQYNHPTSDPFKVQEEIAGSISERLRLKLHRARGAGDGARATEGSEAYVLYLKGRYFWNKRSEQGVRKAARFFRRATAAAPGYAPAYAGLADCYHTLCTLGVIAPKRAYPKAKAAALRALELDDRLPEPHASLGIIATRYEWDWERAERHFRRALELNPNYTTARQWYAVYLSATGRHDEAIEQCALALRLDPLSPIINTLLGAHYFMARHYDEAVAPLLNALEIEPDFVFARAGLGGVYLKMGKIAEAMAEMERAAHIIGYETPQSLQVRGFVHAVAGQRRKARRILAALLENKGGKFVSPFEVARIFVALGEHDAALEWLTKACEERVGDMIYVKWWPEFEPLRADLRFRELQRRMNMSA